MAQPLPSIGEAVRLAYSDLARVGRSLGGVAAIALVIVLVSDLGERLLLAPGPESGNDVTLASYVVGLVQTLLVTPYLLAVHRLVVLDETTRTYALTPFSDRRIQVYFLCWAVLSTLATAPGFLPSLAALDQPVGGLIGFAVIGYLAGVMVLGLRMTLLFPAVAVDAPGVGFEAALADAKGHVWRIFATGLVAGLPLMVFAYLTPSIFGSTGGGALFASLLRSFIAFVLLTQFVVISSRLYVWLGTRLNEAS